MWYGESRSELKEINGVTLMPLPPPSTSLGSVAISCLREEATFLPHKTTEIIGILMLQDLAMNIHYYVSKYVSWQLKALAIHVYQVASKNLKIKIY